MLNMPRNEMLIQCLLGTDEKRSCWNGKQHSAIYEGQKEEIIEKGMAKILNMRFWFKRKKNNQNHKSPLSHVTYLNVHYVKPKFLLSNYFLQKYKLLLREVDLPASFSAKA